MKKDPRLPEGDDGRTIVNMNVEGMPWYQKPSPDAVPEGEDTHGAGGGSSRAPYQMTKEESRFLWQPSLPSYFSCLSCCWIFPLCIKL